MEPLGIWAQPDVLNGIEAAHRSKVGELFCYAAVRWIATKTPSDLY